MKKRQFKVNYKVFIRKNAYVRQTFIDQFYLQVSGTIYFPDETIKKIYPKYLIEKVYIYHVSTDTDSTCLKFVFVSSTHSDIPGKKFRDVIFEVSVATKIYNRFDSSNIYREIFKARKENLRKCLGYFETEHIDNLCFLRCC